jgi:hypothetical protein
MMSIFVTYPDFRSLPQGIKSLLVVSESFFFEETERPSAEREIPASVFREFRIDETGDCESGSQAAAALFEMEFATMS